MARNGNPSFMKRQKEIQRTARAEAKRQARRARQQERSAERSAPEGADAGEAALDGLEPLDAPDLPDEESAAR